MSGEEKSQDHEEQAIERREGAGKRLPFDSLVEVGGALGPAFEAQAVDVSSGGLHLRTAYLPELGQPLTCRFDAAGREVLASGAVVWRHAEERGGEFAIRFDQLDPESAEALHRVVEGEPACAPRDPGTRVRLHIDGLGQPMRAKVKGSAASELTVGSELGFLQVGKQLELEDTTTGGKRPARIDRVEVEIDPTTKVPQLVVTLRYDAGAEDVSAPVTVKSDGTPEPSVIEGKGDDDAMDGVANMKGAFARGAAKVGPLVSKLAKRAMVTAALLAARVRKTEAAAPRRMTAPPPGGGLHASGRRVVRSDASLDAATASKLPRLRGKRGFVIGGGVACAAVIAVVALHKSPSPPAVAATPETSPAVAVASPQLPAVAPQPLPQTLGAQPPATPPAEPEPAPAPAAEDSSHKRPGRVTPFGNGAVTHGNQLHIKMDGPIEKIEGASTPTGFTVVIPSRKSLEAAAPLAARDPRIASMRVTNEAHGAELAVTFKDGVPNYQVRAKGDTLEVILAVPGRFVESDTSHTIPKVASKKRVKH